MSALVPSGQVLERVRAFVREHGLLDAVADLRVGFSGGADSTALLVILCELFRGERFTAVHLHHGIRGRDADADAVWCEAFCREHGIPFESVRLDVPSRRLSGESLEAAARRRRLDYWRMSAGADGVAVALGHHADDAVETLLLRLTRGSNVSGLVALRPLRFVGGVRFIRPLLVLRRVEIEAFLRACGIREWCEDRSNRDVRLRRNAVRHRWLPVIRESLEGDDNGLLRSLDALADDADFLEAEACLVQVRTPRDLARLHPALLPRVLRRWIAGQLGHDVLLRRDAVVRVREELARREVLQPRRIPLGDGIVVVVTPDSLRVERGWGPLVHREWPWRVQPVLEMPECGMRIEAAVVSDSVKAPGCALEAAMNVEAVEEVFAESALPDILTVRGRMPGDRLVPFGRRKPVKLQDVFVNAGVPREWRDAVPVVIAGGEIIWVAGVRRAEFGRVVAAEASVQKTVRFRFHAPHGFSLRGRNGRSGRRRGGGA